MERAYLTPGVYGPSEDVIPRSAPQLQTGVPGFVGFVNSEFAELFRDPVSLIPKCLSLNNSNEFDNRFQGCLPEGGYLDEAVHGFFLNGGVRCYVVCVGFSTGGAGSNKEAPAKALQALSSNEEGLVKGLQALSPLTDLDLIAAPDAMRLTGPDGLLDVEAVKAVKRVQSEMLKHCEMHGTRFAILDALPKEKEVMNEVVKQRRQITQGLREPVHGALYYPWLTISKDLCVPPSGHIAGIFARSDARVGVFKAPANEEVLGVLDLSVGSPGNWHEININNQVQDQLNPEGINCLRAFPGRGIRVWGARSLSGDPDWRYVNVCRLVITLRRWIEMNMTWVSFEPNTPQLWVRIARELTVYLTDFWRAGALAGRTIDEAFYIKCDLETNPQQAIEAGQVVTDIGLAPGTPAEFVIVRVVQQSGVEPR
jgi:phage tail sheath protein FI